MHCDFCSDVSDWMNLRLMQSTATEEAATGPGFCIFISGSYDEAWVDISKLSIFDRSRLNLVVGTGTGPRPACQNYPRKESTKIYMALETVKTISKLCIPDDDHQNYREIVLILENLVNKNSSTCEENATWSFSPPTPIHEQPLLALSLRSPAGYLQDTGNFM